MDLNQLLYHHQMALMVASQARRDGHLLPNFDLPRYYTKRINEYRDRRGLNKGFAGLAIQTPSGPRADPPTSESAANYPAFIGDTLIAELLIHKALSMTPQERGAAALESIIDQLIAIQEELRVIGRDIYRSLGLDEKALATLAADLPLSHASPENEAVRLDPLRPRSEEGIVHTYVEQFTVGAYRYSNIDDARAALLRQRIGMRCSEEQANDA